MALETGEEMKCKWKSASTPVHREHAISRTLEQLTREGRAWRILWDEDQLPCWKRRWTEIAFASTGDVFGGENSRSWVKFGIYEL